MKESDIQKQIIEVKTRRGRQSERQKKFQEDIEAAGGMYILWDVYPRPGSGGRGAPGGKEQLRLDKTALKRQKT